MRDASQRPEARIVVARGARLNVAVGAGIVLVLAALVGAVLAWTASGRGVSSVTEAPADDAPAIAEPLTVTVHVLGAVASPGLYTLPEGARVVDAVAAAGGFADGADRAAMNLARVLVDAEQLRVPVVGETTAEGAAGVGADGRVNLNTADRAALETLPGVGPALAERIIAWREANGGFRSVDDLLEVSGIGEKTLEGMRDAVVV